MKKPFTHLGGTSGRINRNPGLGPKPKLNLRAQPEAKAKPPAEAAGNYPGSEINRNNWRYAEGVDRYSPNYAYHKARYGK